MIDRSNVEWGLDRSVWLPRSTRSLLAFPECGTLPDGRCQVDQLGCSILTDNPSYIFKRMHNIDYLNELRTWLRQTSEVPTPQDLAGMPILIVGAGTMGAEIATLAADAGVPIGLYDTQRQAASDLAQHLARRDPECNVQFHPELTDVASRPYALVIETITEQLEAKRRLLAELEQWIPKSTLLTSNTSTLPLKSLADSLTNPDRLVGMHFLLPVRDREIIEIVAPEGGSPLWVTSACQWCKQLGKLPLVVGDEIGFLVNRLLNAVLVRAVELWADGIFPVEIDRAALEFGLGFGPFIAMDHIGLDTVVRAGAVFWRKFPDQPRPSPLLPALVKRRRLGRKVDHGIYDYDQGGIRDSSRATQLEFLSTRPEILGGVCEEVNSIWQRYHSGTLRSADRAWIQSCLWTALIREAVAVCDEGYVKDARAVDSAWLFGLGISRDLGGPFQWALQEGHVDSFAWEMIPEIEPMLEGLRQHAAVIMSQ